MGYLVRGEIYKDGTKVENDEKIADTKELIEKANKWKNDFIKNLSEKAREEESFDLKIPTNSREEIKNESVGNIDTKIIGYIKEENIYDLYNLLVAKSDELTDDKKNLYLKLAIEHDSDEIIELLSSFFEKIELDDGVTNELQSKFNDIINDNIYLTARDFINKYKNIIELMTKEQVSTFLNAFLDNELLYNSDALAVMLSVFSRKTESDIIEMLLERLFNSVYMEYVLRQATALGCDCKLLFSLLSGIENIAKRLCAANILLGMLHSTGDVTEEDKVNFVHSLKLNCTKENANNVDASGYSALSNAIEMLNLVFVPEARGEIMNIIKSLLDNGANIENYDLDRVMRCIASDEYSEDGNNAIKTLIRLFNEDDNRNMRIVDAINKLIDKTKKRLKQML